MKALDEDVALDPSEADDAGGNNITDHMTALNSTNSADLIFCRRCYDISDTPESFWQRLCSLVKPLREREGIEPSLLKKRQCWNWATWYQQTMNDTRNTAPQLALS